MSDEKIKGLTKTIPYKWRIQSFSKNKPKAQCVAYIDSRDVMDLLDEVMGPENWQDKYEVVNNLLFCNIGIKRDDEWVWKGDTGIESNIEKEKGHSSDAFKRAAVKWGIGRFLYSLPIQFVNTNAPKSNDNPYPYVVDNQGNRVWDITEHINNKQSAKPEKKPEKTLKEKMFDRIKELNDDETLDKLDNWAKEKFPENVYIEIRDEIESKKLNKSL